jgi:levansucrase
MKAEAGMERAAAEPATALRWRPGPRPGRPLPELPLIDSAQLVHPLPGQVLWDHWPVQGRDGAVAEVAGGQLAIFLSAPRRDDPDIRHGEARLRLLWRKDGIWHDRGLLLPRNLSPGSREWAGSARLDSDGRLTLLFTAAGRAGEAALSFDQRLFTICAQLSADETSVRLSDWTGPHELVSPDGDFYVSELAGGGAVGTIKAFRDPAWFTDPVTGACCITFAASLGRSRADHNAAIGLAVRSGGVWRLLPPLADADGVSNELERPHLVAHGGRIYLFWSMLAKVLAPGLAWPTGLYGAVADRLEGPWTLLNGDGLVACTPAAAPEQSYSWLVNHDLSVWSFADRVGTPPAFAGCPAPVLRLQLEGDRAEVRA